jgi:hypothetical protein
LVLWDGNGWNHDPSVKIVTGTDAERVIGEPLSLQVGLYLYSQGIQSSSGVTSSAIVTNAVYTVIANTLIGCTASSNTTRR